MLYGGEIMGKKLPKGWTFKYVGRIPPFNGKGYIVLREGIPQFHIGVDRQITIERHMEYIWRREFEQVTLFGGGKFAPQGS